MGRGGGGGRRGGNKTGGRADLRREGERARVPIDGGVVACEPGKSQDHLKVGEPNDIKGNVLRMHAMYSETGRKVVGNERGRAAIDEFDKNGVGVGKGDQMGLEED